LRPYRVRRTRRRRQRNRHGGPDQRPGDGVVDRSGDDLRRRRFARAVPVARWENLRLDPPVVPATAGSLGWTYRSVGASNPRERRPSAGLERGQEPALEKRQLERAGLASLSTRL